MAGQPIPMRIGDVEVLVETTTVPGSQRTSRIDTAVERAEDAFTRAQEAIMEIAGSTVEAIRKSTRRAARPDELTVEFGVKFSVKGDVIVAGVSGDATLKVSLTYRSPSGDRSESS